MDVIVLIVEYVINLIWEEPHRTDPPDVRNVLVFGSSGVGKTTLINNLAGENFPTGSGAKGTTLETRHVRVDHLEVKYRIFDTAGLNEADKGSVSGTDAVMNLARLLKHTEGGLNLMVMVVRHGTIQASTKANYQLFVETMTSGSVPLLIVVTHCEREIGDMQVWIDQNRRSFLEQGIQSKKMVATTFITPDPSIDNEPAMHAKVEASCKISWESILECAEEERIDYMNLGGGVVDILRRAYNKVASFYGSGPVWVSKGFVTLIKNATGRTHEESKKIAKKIEAETSG